MVRLESSEEAESVTWPARADRLEQTCVWFLHRYRSANNLKFLARQNFDTAGCTQRV